MINGFYAAKSGAIGFQKSLDVTANNIANVNTQGFKARSAVFSELIATSANGSDIMIGNGSRISSVTRDTSQGPLAHTGDEFDVMISGNGYFAVQGMDENIYYTRSGSFSASSEGNLKYLVTTNGDYVLDEDLNRIEVRGEAISSLGRAGVFRFDNPEGLTSEGNGKYAANEYSGEAIIDQASKKTIRAQELSNVDLVTEMTNMITAQRGFQLNIRMAQTADEIEQIVNNLR